MTENQFIEILKPYGNGASRFDFEKQRSVDIYYLHKGSDHIFSMSYHLTFPEKNVKYNFWYEKQSYINSVPKVTISFWNGKEKRENDRLKNIFDTENADEFENKVKEIFERMVNG